MSHVRIRGIGDADWPAIESLEHEAYGSMGLSEPLWVLQSRARISPTTSCALEITTRIRGYLVALPYPYGQYPTLDRVETSTSAVRNLHLHDIVVSPSLRRQGAARYLVSHLMLTASAQAYEQVSLVSVGGTRSYWAARGFAEQAGVLGPESGYGAEAAYMTKRVAPRDR